MCPPSLSRRGHYGGANWRSERHVARGTSIATLLQGDVRLFHRPGAAVGQPHVGLAAQRSRSRDEMCIDETPNGNWLEVALDHH